MSARAAVAGAHRRHRSRHVSAQAPDAARIRAAFLQMIERPRVPLAPETQPRLDAGSYRAEQFSFASEAGERVPGVFLKSRAPRTIAGRPSSFSTEPAARKEEFLALDADVRRSRIRDGRDRRAASRLRASRRSTVRQRAVFCGDARDVSHRQGTPVSVRHRVGCDAARRLSRDARRRRSDAHRRDGHFEREAPRRILRPRSIRESPRRCRSSACRDSGGRSTTISGRRVSARSRRRSTRRAR